MSIYCMHGTRLDDAEGKRVDGFTVVLHYKWSLLSANFSVHLIHVLFYICGED